jgi:hypothetical protein
MRIPKSDVPVKIDVPGAVARQLPDFGDPSGLGPFGAEYLSLGAGTDIAPLLVGLDDDACQAPHWGYVISGRIVVNYTNGTEETCTAGDLLYWPPGHSVRVVDDAEFVLFSPHKEHTAVIEHMSAKMAEAAAAG